MPKDDTSVRNAGAQIASSGLVDDVISAGGRDLSQRQSRRNAEDTDSHDAEPKRRGRKAPKEPEEHFDDEADDSDGDEDEFEGNADDGSDRDSEETDEDGEEGDSQSDDDGEEGDDADDEPSEDEAKHKVKVQGREFEVTLRELKAGYQRNRDYQIKTHALAKNTRELIEGHTKKAQEYARALHTVTSITEGLKKLIVGDMDSQQMRQLRATDPAQWAVQRELMGEKIEVLNRVFEGLTDEAKKHATGVTERQQADLKALASAEVDKLVNAIPDWFTPNGPNQKNGMTRVAEFLTKKAGFTADEVNGVYDSRMLIVADFARRYMDLLERQKAAQGTRKRSGAPKKVVKPGTTQVRRSDGGKGKNAREFERAKTQAKKTGTIRDAGKAIARLI